VTAQGDCSACSTRPFRIFFVFGALAATAGVLPWSAGISPSGTTARAWHSEMLLFGMMPAVMAGFLLTALPRWTGSLPISRPGMLSLAVFWLAGRTMPFCYPALTAPMAAGFILCIAGVLALRVIEAGALREIKVVLLLLALAAAAIIPVAGFDAMPGGLHLRLALAGELGLVAVIAGRIAPALTASYLALRGQTYGPRLPRWFEVAAALSLAVALGLWTCDAPGQAPVSLIAAGLQAARLLSWRPWRAGRYAGLVAIHLAYAWIPLGLGLNVLRAARLGVSDPAVLHAWAAGTVGAMGLAVMASMVRRQSRQAFSSPIGLRAMVATSAVAAPIRLLPEFGLPLQPSYAALCWSAAFLLFLAAYRRPLGLSWHAVRQTLPSRP